MVHGAFCGGWIFDSFRKPFETLGHVVHTPDLAGHSAGSGREATAGLSMADYAKQIIQLCQAQDEPPILIGHSMGGLVAQLAAQACPVKALILLAPSAPWGITGVTMEEAASAVSLFSLGPFWLQAVAPDYSLARLYSLDRMSREDRHATFDRMVAESGRALWETLNWWLDPFMTTMVYPGRITAPSLAIAGGRDIIHPPGTVKQTIGRLNGDLQVFNDMSHWLPGEPGHEAVATACLEWISKTSD